MIELWVLAFVVLPLSIVLGGYALVRYTEHKYGIDPRKPR